MQLFLLILESNYPLFISDRGNDKKNIVGIIVGVTIFGLMIFVCILGIKNKGKYTDII